jgi:hypothetical protein
MIRGYLFLGGGDKEILSFFQEGYDNIQKHTRRRAI